MTAVSAAREGVKVALLEPGSHLGGMATGGLSRTDFGKKEVIGGYPLEFYWRVGQKYDLARFAQALAWYYEPHVGEQVLTEMLRAGEVEVSCITGCASATASASTVQRFFPSPRKTALCIRGRVFADCSYEGDLMAQAGISFTWGRESSAQYGESLAGVRERTPYHQFLVPISGYDSNHRLLPEISAEPKGATGSADKKVQAYNFRMILSDDPANQVPFPKPPNYDPHRYELVARLLGGEYEKTRAGADAARSDV